MAVHGGSRLLKRPRRAGRGCRGRGGRSQPVVGFARGGEAEGCGGGEGAGDVAGAAGQGCEAVADEVRDAAG